MSTRLDTAIGQIQPRAAAMWRRARGALWLVALALPIANLLGQHPAPLQLALSLAGVALFVVLFARVMLTSPLSRPQLGISPRDGAMSMAVLTAVAVALIVFDGSVWLDMLVYATAFAGVVLTERQALRVVVALTVASFAFSRLYALDWGNMIGSVLITLGGGLLTIGYRRLVGTVTELRAAQDEIRRLAVAEERLRIARDLHDLLGHSLSLIALKSELAVRLSPAAPERAAAEIADVESVARQALQEMREAVATYRQPTLASELRGANELLSAAGIAYTCIGNGASDTGLLPAAEAALAWAVREGVTNVIRHSRAQHCTIRLSREADRIRLDIRDDGRGASVNEPAPGAGGTPAGHERRGSGLAGLKERVAALGGRCEAGPCPEAEGGGFRLAVSLPLDAPASLPEAAPAPADGAAAREAKVAG